MKKPPDIVHGLEETPPAVVTMFCGLQHVGQGSHAVRTRGKLQGYAS